MCVRSRAWEEGPEAVVGGGQVREGRRERRELRQAVPADGSAARVAPPAVLLSPPLSANRSLGRLSNSIVRARLDTSRAVRLRQWERSGRADTALSGEERSARFGAHAVGNPGGDAKKRRRPPRQAWVGFPLNFGGVLLLGLERTDAAREGEEAVAAAAEAGEPGVRPVGEHVELVAGDVDGTELREGGDLGREGNQAVGREGEGIEGREEGDVGGDGGEGVAGGGEGPELGGLPPGGAGGGGGERGGRGGAGLRVSRGGERRVRLVRERALWRSAG